jgi:hypothetical protein
MRNQNGTFARTFQIWTPDNWDGNGYIDNEGRFRIYRPDYPRVYKGGFALRSHVVYWLTTGEVHPSGTELHHKNRIKNDDRFENLIVLTHSQHQIEHKSNWVTVTCAHCGKIFKEHAWRVSQRNVRFCSQTCYRIHPRSPEHKANISAGIKLAYKEGRR